MHLSCNHMFNHFYYCISKACVYIAIATRCMHDLAKRQHNKTSTSNSSFRASVEVSIAVVAIFFTE